MSRTLRWHDLRHEAAPRLFEKGLHPMEVATITGHRSMQMLKTHTHLKPESLLGKLGWPLKHSANSGPVLSAQKRRFADAEVTRA
ncbi:tyrosine-type recombinase/integrase [Burkholderia multivorans]|uniref:tyrosine-type recombinase/integrase n=1 Tax=Burkholderia multivorans TaxID=87883 RepID=UPI0030D1BEAA